jgi:glycosyltransferase involved in cell wall biosynthesis
MKFAIVAHGRFHAFDLAKALLKQGHEVTVFTNYPIWAAKKFGLPASAIRSFWMHGVLSRIVHKFSNSNLRWDTSRFLNPLFGRWVAAQVAKQHYDVVHSFSGVAVELLATRAGTPDDPERPIHLIVRGSAHIAVQDAILREEELRSKQRIERPSRSIIEREKKEYREADRVITLSTFAYRSFLDQGLSKEKLSMLPLGVNVHDFSGTAEVVQARRLRISSGAPLRVLWVGTMSLQKGIVDYRDIVKALRGQNFQFRFVGDIPKNVRSFADEIADVVEFIPRQRQWNLRQQYDWGDVFIFPTIQDGFAVVLAQANANGLPILTTTNCAGPDMIRDDSTGWVLPIRSPKAFVDRLRWCDQNRDAVVAMATRIGEEFVPRTWDDVARDFHSICKSTSRALRAAPAGR